MEHSRPQTRLEAAASALEEFPWTVALPIKRRNTGSRPSRSEALIDLKSEIDDYEFEDESSRAASLVSSAAMEAAVEVKSEAEATSRTSKVPGQFLQESDSAHPPGSAHGNEGCELNLKVSNPIIDV